MDAERRAVVASVAPEAPEAAVRGAGFAPVGRAKDAAGALSLLRRLQADLLLADAVLPGMDGPALAEAVLALPLRVRPAVLLIAPGGMAVPGAEGLAARNAALLPGPAESAAVAAAWAALRARAPSLPERCEARLRGQLDALGVPEHPGRRALAAAVTLAWWDGRRLVDRKRNLYPQAARMAGMTPAQAERAIRYVIDAAWRTGAMEEQNRIFGDTIDARRGRPTCGEMIAQLAEHLRWEGYP